MPHDDPRGKPGIPVLKVPSTVPPGTMTVTFSAELWRLVEDAWDRDALVRKAYAALTKYGFRGHSRGGVNGIVFQREADRRMLAATDSLANAYRDEIAKALGVAPAGLPRLRKVKGVFHDPHGRRLVGVYDPAGSRIILLGFAQY